LPARILVVDDDPLSAELICEILRSAGLDASFLTSSAEAAARLKRERYHAVFLDMRMPAPDGAELARQVRASRVNSSTVIVMITGEQDRTVMGRAFEAGVEFFLFKPVERNKLLKLIRARQLQSSAKGGSSRVFRYAAESRWNQAKTVLRGRRWISALAARWFSRTARFHQVPRSRSVWNLMLAPRTCVQARE
jgi:PleD family two-component response regulator